MDIIKRPRPQKIPEQFIQQKPSYKKNEIFISSLEASQMQKANQAIPKKHRLKKLFFSFIGIFLFLIITFVGFFFWKVHKVSNKINIEISHQTSLMEDVASAASAIIPSKRSPLEGEENGRINILLLGAAGKNDAGRNLTDTIMVMSIDTTAKKMALISLPRDLYVQIPETKSFTKINSLYPIGLKNEQGVELIQKSVEHITGLSIKYYLIANYDGFKKIIDDIGGINITVERDIYDSRFPGPNYSYETFQLSKGFHTLDGSVALKYVRERHDDPQGDFGRAKRQQQVIQAVKNKFFSVQTLFNVITLNNILDTVGDNIQTNINLEDIESFLSLSKEIDMQNINNIVFDAWKKDSLLKVSHVMFGEVRAFVLVPRVGNYSELQDASALAFDMDTLKKRRDQIDQEKATISVINRSGDFAIGQKILSLLKDKLSLPHTSIYAEVKQTQDQTIVIDNTNKQKIYTLDELLKKIPASLSINNENIPEDKNDFTVILGKDLIDIYKYDEDRIEDLTNTQDDQNFMELIN